MPYEIPVSVVVGTLGSILFILLLLRGANNETAFKNGFHYFLLLAVVIVSLCYLTYNTYGNWSFALALRGKKLLAFIFVGIAAAFQLLVFKRSRKIIS